MQERRAHKRLREENQVAVTVLAAADAPELVNKTFFCPTEDVSANGLRIAVNHAVPVGALLGLRIAFHKPLRSFKHEGVVVWLHRGNFAGRPYALGIQFTKFQDGTQEAWHQMMDRKIAGADEGSVAIEPPAAAKKPA